MSKKGIVVSSMIIAFLVITGVGIGVFMMKTSNPSNNISFPPFLDSPSDDDGGYHDFYAFSELESGSINFSICPLELDAIKVLDPLGNLNPEMGHTFPTTHSAFRFNDTESEGAPYEVKAPASGYIAEIAVSSYNSSTGYGDFRVGMAHTKDIFTEVGHISNLSQPIIDEIGIIEENQYYRVKIPITEGEIIGYAGGQSAPVAGGMDWNIYDQTITPHFIIPSRYNRKAYAVGMTYRCEEPLRSNLTDKIVERTEEPKIGELDFDKDGYLVGNWFYENITLYDDIMGQWDKFLAFGYNPKNHSQIRICAGGILNINHTAVYNVSGNAPDPAQINGSHGAIAYNLTSVGRFVSSDERTILVEVVEGDSRKIKIEAFEGHIAAPTFTDPKYYIR